MKNIFQSIITICFISGLFSCKTNLKENPITRGDADFSRYVAIGNSLTAGYSDGALSREGQMNSYPKMLSEQFELAGGGAFKIPYMNDGGGNDGSGIPRRVLGYVIPCNSNQPTLSPVLDPRGMTVLNNISAAGPYNLVGVPGARAVDANVPGYAFFNSFFQRFCQSPGTSTLLTEALRSNPTFFTLWLGSNDVLLYGTSGGTSPIFKISSDSAVNANLSKIVDTLVKNGAKGAIANVPDITSIPYFTTIPWNGAVISQAQADALNHLYDSIGLTFIDWTAGANGFIIADTNAPGDMRHATAQDYILLTTPGDSLKCAYWGLYPSKPLADKYVLSANEAAAISDATSKYNNHIASLATKYNLALVDINSFLKTVKSGLVFNGVSMNTVFVSGGAISLDGVHPTQRGYAFIANEFLKAINAKYKSSIPLVDPTKYNTVVFP